jgi:hypothetical protein
LSTWTRAAAAAAATLVAGAIAGCINAVPMTLAESFSNPDIVSPNAPRPKKRAANDPGCALVIDAIADERSDPRMLGSVAGRPVHAPENVNAWLHNVLAGLGTRGITVTFDAIPAGAANPLVASMTLRIAWVSEISTSKSATTLWHMRLRDGENPVADADFRGADTVLNWSSGDAELQHMVDRAFGRSLDLMATEVRKHCSAG